MESYQFMLSGKRRYIPGICDVNESSMFKYYHSSVFPTQSCWLEKHC